MAQDFHLAGYIIRDEHGKILLLHRNTPKRMQWEIPGGKIDEGENPETTARREVREELGIIVTVQREVGERSFAEDGYTMKYTWFAANIISGSPTIMEPDTHDACRFFSIEDMENSSNELSPNAANFFEELQAKRITL